MQTPQNIHQFQIIRNYLDKNGWIALYFSFLVLFIILGRIFTESLPLALSNIPSEEAYNYSDFAPGWASKPFFRSFLEPWARWDTISYLSIAAKGYPLDGGLVAFPPIYPLLIHFLGRVLGRQYLLVALLISWSSLFGVCLLLNERVGQYNLDQSSFSVIRNMFFFPTALFLFAGYTESLFLFLSLLAWRNAERGRWVWTGLVGAVAVLTRFMGVFLILPFGYIWWKSRPQKNIFTSICALALIPLTYFSWEKFSTVKFNISPAEALNKGWALHFNWPWVGITGSIKMILSEPISKTFFAYVDIFATIAALWALFWWLKKKDYPEVLFIASILMISMMKISDIRILGSTSRYILPLFPIYFTLPSIKNSVIRRVFLVFTIGLWCFSIAMFFSWNWLA